MLELKPFLTDLAYYTRLHRGLALRPYQLEAAQGVLGTIARGAGEKACMVFSRQAGKDETIAQLIGFLLLGHSTTGGSIVVAAPTARPQAEITRSRVLDRLTQNPLTRPFVRASEGTVAIGKARAVFLGQHGNARGQTASILLIANEAQDIEPDRWDAVFEPMGASVNAPTLFSGTVWTRTGLLAREMDFARSQTTLDGLARVFEVPWQRVAADVPAYGDRVRARIAQFGEAHPFIRTEYELIPLDGDGGLFDATRQALLTGTHPRRRTPTPGERVAFLVDVAGEEEGATGLAGFDPDSRRDSTVLTIVALNTADELTRYEVLDRQAWTGTPWQTVRGALMARMRQWSPIVTVIDATGIGHGLVAWLRASLPRERIEPFTFTSQSKSELGWGLVGLIDSGRLADYDPDDQDDTRAFWEQLRATTYQIASEHNRLMRWGVPSPGHDDLVLSLALVATLEQLDLRPRTARGR